MKTYILWQYYVLLERYHLWRESQARLIQYRARLRAYRHEVKAILASHHARNL